MSSAPYVVVDFETQSAVDIKKAGAEKYAASYTTKVLCLAYAWPTGPVQLWRPGEPLPADLIYHVAHGFTVSAHNAPFEFSIWNLQLCKAAGWPPLSLEQLDCTMARARAMALPGGLGECCAALRLPVRKDDEGHGVMMQLARPRRKAPVLEFWTPETAPEKFERLYEYCKIDVLAQRQLHQTLMPLSPKERELWILSEKINQRGVPLDIPNVQRAFDMLAIEKKELSNKVHVLTGGASTATTRDKLLAWLQTEGVESETLRKGDVAALLASDLAEDSTARLVLQIRQEASKASTSKLTAMLACAGNDNRARGLFQFNGANTGRYAGKRVQTQNMARPPKGFKAKDAENVIEWLKHPGANRALRAEYGSSMEAVSWAIRGFIKASEGRRFIACDYSNIEGRVLAWLAGEEWKLDAFRDYDTFKLDPMGQKISDGDGDYLRIGPDLYKLAYSKSFGISIELVDADNRQIGKVQELALGFGGGIGSFISMGANYGVVPDKIAAAVKAVTPTDVWEKALKKLPRENGRFRYGLSPDTWTGLRVVVDSWRAAHPETVRLWHLLEQAACSAIESPGQITSAGRIKYRMTGDFLLCRLPSGRALSYPYASLKPTPTVRWEEKLEELRDNQSKADNTELAAAIGKQIAEHLAKPETELRMRYWGVSSKAGSSKKWREQRAYGGLLAENVTQATARDVLTDAMPRAEAAGYPIVMHVHDELLPEVENGKGSLSELAQIMCAVEPWAHGLPVAAAGWEGKRYRKG